ncbi:Metallo-dependent phosphatase [Anaeromyces robustus]|uniref:Metallo-dependent phosphatase n=1 Tax=Anaeromyces robustus TaxID=1754192 RepID=A0A1Y1VS44_9FUNG|nr:Metallo-dependent phosphatase [Anaeromyces robustus]|eukprot:ORX63993.1 Metallo-dependent phosphatase [Anaeromyces robustus]
MNNFKFQLKHYLIFLITIICYCIGFSIYFIAQHEGTRPKKNEENLSKFNPELYQINSNSRLLNNTNIDNSKYAKPDNLFYFLQISDIHMSDRYTKGAQGHLYYFLQKMIPILDPNFLFITGDITDSISKKMSLETTEDEWKMYRKIIESTNITTKNNGTFLWDLRGNHDCFRISEWDSPYNYYKDYSHTKTRGFTFNYETSYGTYSFVGLDGCPILSAAKPFFGIVDNVSMDLYSNFMNNAKSNPNNKHNFVFMHFPETTATFGKSSSGKSWNDYTKDISLLLTGHFHNIVGKYIYAYHPDYLEMELIDFKLKGRYRIVAIDNDVVSITDNTLPLPNIPYDFKTNNIDDLINHPPEVFKQNIPPVVHITSPKNSRFVLKRGEPIKESLTSEYIRVLVFSDQSPSNLKLSLYIDNKLQSTEFTYLGDQKLDKRSSTNKIKINSNINSKSQQNIIEENIYNVDAKTPPLWIAKWDKSAFNDGKSHELKVIATDINNQNHKGENVITFRLDGKSDSLGIPFIGKLLLKSVLYKSLPVIFGILYIIYEIMIILPRLYAIKNIIPKHSNLPFFPNKHVGDIISEETVPFQEGFFKKHFILPFIEAFTLNGIFYPIQIIMICLVVLPTKIGNITKPTQNVSKYGSEFLYGIYGSGQWANIADQYLTFIPLFILIIYLNTFIIVLSNHKKQRHHILSVILLIFLCLIQLLLSSFMTNMIGGIMAIFFSPFPVWITIYTWVLIFIIMIRRFRNHEDKIVTPELNAISV